MTRRFGVEIEALGMSRGEVAALLVANGITCRDAGYTHHVESGWKVVSDASVGAGFEIVSPPLSGEEGLAEVAKVVELLNEAGCDVNKKCGVHVHVEANDLTGEHIANVYNRYRTHEAEIDALMPRSRRANANRYCKSLTGLQPVTAYHSAVTTCRQRYDRYYKVNLCSFVKYGTIEFRQHGGSLNKAKIVNWVRFLLQFVEASRPTTEPVFRGKTKAIVDLLNQPRTVNELAHLVNSTPVTIRSRIFAIRKRGVTIVNRGGRYEVVRSEAGDRQRSNSLWDGIDQAIVRYYDRRRSLLAAA